MARAIPQVVKKFEHVSYEREVLGKDPVVEHDEASLVSRKLDVNLYMSETEAHIVHALLALGLEMARRAQEGKKAHHAKLDEIAKRTGKYPKGQDNDFPESWVFDSIEIPGNTGWKLSKVNRWGKFIHDGDRLLPVLTDALVVADEIKREQHEGLFFGGPHIDFAFEDDSARVKEATSHDELPPGVLIAE